MDLLAVGRLAALALSGGALLLGCSSGSGAGSSASSTGSGTGGIAGSSGTGTGSSGPSSNGSTGTGSAGSASSSGSTGASSLPSFVSVDARVVTAWQATLQYPPLIAEIPPAIFGGLAHAHGLLVSTAWSYACSTSADPITNAFSLRIRA
jgi:hypothetical protein